MTLSETGRRRVMLISFCSFAAQVLEGFFLVLGIAPLVPAAAGKDLHVRFALLLVLACSVTVSAGTSLYYLCVHHRHFICVRRTDANLAAFRFALEEEEIARNGGPAHASSSDEEQGNNSTTPSAPARRAPEAIEQAPRPQTRGREHQPSHTEAQKEKDKASDASTQTERGRQQSENSSEKPTTNK